MWSSQPQGLGLRERASKTTALKTILQEIHTDLLHQVFQTPWFFPSYKLLKHWQSQKHCLLQFSWMRHAVSVLARLHRKSILASSLGNASQSRCDSPIKSDSSSSMHFVEVVKFPNISQAACDSLHLPLLPQFVLSDLFRWAAVRADSCVGHSSRPRGN